MELNDITFADENNSNSTDLVSVDKDIVFVEDDIVPVQGDITKQQTFKKVADVNDEPTLVIEAPEVKLKPFGRTRNVNYQSKVKSSKKSTKQTIEDSVINSEHLGDLPGDIMYNMMENLENSLHQKKENVKSGVKSVASGVANGVMAAKFPASSMQMVSLNNGGNVYLVPGTIVMDTSGNMVMMTNDCNFMPAGQSDIATAAFNAGANMARNALLQRMTPTEAVSRFGFTQDEVNMAINGGQSQQMVGNMAPQQQQMNGINQMSLEQGGFERSSGSYTPAMDARRRRAAAIMQNVNVNQSSNSGLSLGDGGYSL